MNTPIYTYTYHAALAAVDLNPDTIIAVLPFPGREPTYQIFEASAGSGTTTEWSFCMRIDSGGGFSPEYQTVRREMDCAELATSHSCPVHTRAAEQTGEGFLTYACHPK